MNILHGFFKKKSFWIFLYSIYISMILLSVQALVAQESVNDIRANMDESYDYYLVFNQDGKTTHYDVMRHNTDEVGKITLTYWTESNKLELHEVSNIKKIKIDVQSMFEDESIKVFQRSSEYIQNMDLEYWFEAGDGIFTVEFNIAADQSLEELIFTEFPKPNSVRVNNQEWWMTELNYMINDDEITISNIPSGETTVILNFNTPNQLPVPLFTMQPSLKAGVGEEIICNGSSSYDPDGEVTTWLWDFGDGSKDSGVTVRYQFNKPGTFTIKLTVRDDAEPYGLGVLYKNITIEYGADEDNDNDGLRDHWEWENFESPMYDSEDDPDTDGYPNGLEFLAGTDPNNNADYLEDSDSDGLGDYWEWENFKSLAQQAQDDPDNDDISNIDEFEAKTDPNNRKSKPEKDDGKEANGMFGFGALMDIMIILLILIILLIVSFIVFRRKNKNDEPKEVVKEQLTNANLPIKGPPKRQYVNQVQQQPQHPSELEYTSKDISKPSSVPNPTIHTCTNPEPVPAAIPVQKTDSIPVPVAAVSRDNNEKYQKVPHGRAPQQLSSPSEINQMQVTGNKKSIPVEVAKPVLNVPDEMVPEPITEEMVELKTKLPNINVKQPAKRIIVKNTGTITSSMDSIVKHFMVRLGIDHQQAFNLYNAGYVRLEYIILASTDELAAVSGIGFETALEIKNRIKDIDNNSLNNRDEQNIEESVRSNIQEQETSSVEDEIPGEELLEDEDI